MRDLSLGEVWYNHRMRRITPFSDKLIFFDAEFTSLEYEKSELLSFGAVTLDGATFYCEIDHDTRDVSDFVREHVLPTLTAPKISLDAARTQIRAFIAEHFGDHHPYLVTYVYKYDAYHWYKLFGYQDEMTQRIILDFASMLFALGVDPEQHSASQRDDFLRTLGIDGSAFAKHNALDDARILRAAYLALAAPQ